MRLKVKQNQGALRSSVTEDVLQDSSTKRLDKWRSMFHMFNLLTFTVALISLGLSFLAYASAPPSPTNVQEYELPMVYYGVNSVLMAVHTGFGAFTCVKAGNVRFLKIYTAIGIILVTEELVIGSWVVATIQNIIDAVIKEIANLESIRSSHDHDKRPSKRDEDETEHHNHNSVSGDEDSVEENLIYKKTYKYYGCCMYAEKWFENKLPSGWTAIERDELIGYDLENTPLELKVKTDSEGDDYKVAMDFYSSEDQYEPAGGLRLFFTDPPQYLISNCTTQTDEDRSDSRSDFQTNLPSAGDKVWRVTLTKSRSSGTRLLVHCNDVEVLNFHLSNSTCGHSDWETFWKWNRTVTRIEFLDSDTASHEYRPYKPVEVYDHCLTNDDLFCGVKFILFPGEDKLNNSITGNCYCEIKVKEVVTARIVKLTVLLFIALPSQILCLFGVAMFIKFEISIRNSKYMETVSIPNPSSVIKNYSAVE